MSARLFIAVDVDARLKAVLSHWREGLAGQLRAIRGLEEPKWVSIEEMHVTLCFLGSVDEDLVVAVQECMARPFGVPVFQASLTRVGVFPASGRPRVLWLGIGAGRDQMLRLHEEVSCRVRDAGVDVEARPFSPHLTLARIRPSSRRSARVMIADVGSEVGSWDVAHVTLYQSILSATGARHVPLVRVPLPSAAR